MFVTLEKTKEYLRVESPDEDELITGMITAAEDIVEGILRFPLSELGTIPPSVEQAVLYLTATLYENRETLSMEDALKTVLGLIAPYRKDGW